MIWPHPHTLPVLCSRFSVLVFTRLQKNNLQQKGCFQESASIGALPGSLRGLLSGSIHHITGIWNLFRIKACVGTDLCHLLHNCCQRNLTPVMWRVFPVWTQRSSPFPVFSRHVLLGSVFSSTGNLIRNYYNQAGFGPQQQRPVQFGLLEVIWGLFF